MAVQYPVIGQWFRRPNGTLFEVVAIDEEAMTVEIQQFDGTVDEYDIERWQLSGERSNCVDGSNCKTKNSIPKNSVGPELQ